MKSLARRFGQLSALAFLLVPFQVAAVAVSPDGSGEALILPFFTVEGGNNTVLTVVNERENPQAIKLIFRDELGETALQLNAYLETYGSLVMALSESDGSTMLTIPDQTCILPALEDISSTALASTSTGFIEIISMGSVENGTLKDAANNQDCEVFEEGWQTGGDFLSDPSSAFSAPESGLRASSSVINVSRGTQYAIPATALIDFSNIVQHTDPMSDKPDLTSAHDAGTPNGTTTSLNCFARASGCVTAEWESPMDAVAGALIAEAGTGEFSIEQEIGARAEVVFTFPLRRHYIDRVVDRTGSFFGGTLPGDALVGARIGLSVFDREGLSEHPRPSCPPQAGIGPPPPNCGDNYRRITSDEDQRAAVDVFSFNADADQFGQTLQTPILGATSKVFFPSTQYPNLPQSGSSLFVMMNSSVETRLTSKDGDRFPGVPFIAVMVQEIRNGTLIDEQSGQAVRANYGTSFKLNFTESDFLRRN